MKTAVIQAALLLAIFPRPASAWNIPGHMLWAAIAHQILQQERPQTIDNVKADVLLSEGVLF
jgi:hypothetical protein